MIDLKSYIIKTLPYNKEGTSVSSVILRKEKCCKKYKKGKACGKCPKA